MRYIISISRFRFHYSSHIIFPSSSFPNRLHKHWTCEERFNKRSTQSNVPISHIFSTSMINWNDCDLLLGDIRWATTYYVTYNFVFHTQNWFDRYECVKLHWSYSFKRIFNWGVSKENPMEIIDLIWRPDEPFSRYGHFGIFRFLRVFSLYSYFCH